MWCTKAHHSIKGKATHRVISPIYTENVITMGQHLTYQNPSLWLRSHQVIKPPRIKIWSWVQKNGHGPPSRTSLTRVIRQVSLTQETTHTHTHAHAHTCTHTPWCLSVCCHWQLYFKTPGENDCVEFRRTIRLYQYFLGSEGSTD